MLLLSPVVANAWDINLTYNVHGFSAIFLSNRVLQMFHIFQRIVMMSSDVIDRVTFNSYGDMFCVCMADGGAHAVRLFNTDPLLELCSLPATHVGGVRVCAFYARSNIVALVAGGAHQAKFADNTGEQKCARAHVVRCSYVV
jgi:hypothetical protein